MVESLGSSSLAGGEMIPNTLTGMQIIESVWLTEAGEPVQVRRTWRERLTTRPWRPWRATKTIIPQVPSKCVLGLNHNTICVHPATLIELRRQLRSPGETS